MSTLELFAELNKYDIPSIPDIDPNCLAITHPEIAKQWHPSNDKSPYEVTYGSEYNAKWICLVCQEIHVVRTADFVRSNKTCKKRYAKPIPKETQYLLNTVSKIETNVIVDYSPNNLLPLAECPLNDAKLIWDCHICKQSWKATYSEYWRGCPVCHTINYGTTKRVTKSIVDSHPEIVLEWSKENEVSPYTITPQNAARRTWKWSCARGILSDGLCYKKYKATYSQWLTEPCPRCGISRKDLSKWLDRSGSIDEYLERRKMAWYEFSLKQQRSLFTTKESTT